MDFDDWAPFYGRIVREFGFDADRDERAAHDLASLLSRPPFAPQAVWDEAANRLRGRDVVVLGASDEAATQLRRIPGAPAVVAADGATTAALEAGIVPRLIVSDLDGHMPDEVAAVEGGSLILVHAHADNVRAVREWLPRLPPLAVAGTCQSRPVPPLQNHGGFTDGDRACFLAHALGARSLRLVGFDFTGRPGRYTGSFDPQTKAKKLQWARRLLDELSARGATIHRS